MRSKVTVLHNAHMHVYILVLIMAEVSVYSGRVTHLELAIK